MQKCFRCQKIKPLDEYPKVKSRVKPSTVCRECKRAYDREYFKTKVDRSKAVVTRRAYKNKQQEYIFEVLKGKVCQDCGNNNPLVLEFDHRDPTLKHNHVTAMLGCGKVKLDLEISRCDIVCANCHRLRTLKQFGSRRLNFFGECSE